MGTLAWTTALATLLACEQKDDRPKSTDVPATVAPGAWCRAALRAQELIETFDREHRFELSAEQTAKMRPDGTVGPYEPMNDACIGYAHFVGYLRGVAVALNETTLAYGNDAPAPVLQFAVDTLLLRDPTECTPPLFGALVEKARSVVALNRERLRGACSALTKR